MPQRRSGKTILNSEEWRSKVAKKNCARAMIAQPTVQSRREPRRSDSAPAMGAMNMIISESATMIHPTCAGEYPSRFWRKKGRRKLMADSVPEIKNRLKIPALKSLV
jgi:hypothetical protein